MGELSWYFKARINVNQVQIPWLNYEWGWNNEYMYMVKIFYWIFQNLAIKLV